MTEAPLDKYGPLESVSPQHAAAVMVRIQRLRHDQVEEVKKLTIEAARKKADAVKVKARAQLTSDGTVEDRKAKANLDSAEAFFEADCAAAVADAAERVMWVLKDDWDTCRSIGANERAEKSAIEGFGS